MQVTGSVIVTQGGFTGSLYGTASWAQNSLTASYAVSASYVVNQNYATFTQSVPSTTWTFNHNLNFRTPIITVYDNNYEVVIPDSVFGSSDNQSIITFSSARAGYASAIIGNVGSQNAFALSLAYAIVL